RRAVIKRERLKHRQELQHVEFVKLQELDRLKSRFFADISHEFRTPLTLILGPLLSLRQASSKTDIEKQCGIIERNALRLLRLINQLLDLSKLEAGKLRLQAAPGNLVPFVKGILYSFESLAQQENITLRFASAADEVTLYFDSEKMEQILTNVLSNAFKFTPKGGEISVQLSVVSNQLPQDRPSTERRLQITVKDTGSGIPAEHLPHIFERFYQIDEAYFKDQPGSGIGLALAKELVQLHKGEIRVASEVGLGTEFTILLPLGKDHLAAEDIVETVVSGQRSVISK
ncbi:MAG: sensor histidine kinase, partial [bacterium]